MKYKFALLFIIMLLSGAGCRIQKNDSGHKQYDDTDMKNWKRLAVSLCVYKSIPFSREMIKKEGSVAGYLQINRTFGLDAFKRTDEFVKKYLKDNPVNSKNNYSLALMRCLEFYESKELNEFIKELKYK